MAVRALRWHRAYAALAIITLALGIGANTAIFSVMNGVFFHRLPYEHGKDMIIIRQPARAVGQRDNGFSVVEVGDYRTQVPSLASADEYHSMTFTLYGEGQPARVTSGVVSSSFFDDLGVQMHLGRTFRTGEDAVGAPALAILSYEFWQSRFGGNPQVIGRTFTMNDKVHTIVGVLPPLPQFPDANDIYIPAGSCPFRSAPQMMNNRAMRMVGMLGRLKPGVDKSKLDTDLRAVSARMHTEYPSAFPRELGLAIETDALPELLSRDARPTFFALLAMTGFLLAVACANVANLTLARHIRRTREMQMRVALGASPWRLLRQLVTESLVIATLGGACGLALAWGTLDMLRSFAGRFTPHTADIRIDGTVLLFTLGISVLTGLLFGALPAIPSRGRPAAAPMRTRLRGILVVSQVAIAFVLLVGAGLLARTLLNLRRVDPGYDASHVMTALVPLNWTKYTDTTAVNGFANTLLTALRQSPGVAAVGVAGALPLDGQPSGRNPLRTDTKMVQAEIAAVGGDYFAAIGSPSVVGRVFADEDRNQQVAIVNQMAARQFWGDAPAVGQRMSADSGRHWFTVVGVVRNVRQHDLTSDVSPMVYIPFARAPQTDIRVLVRGTGSFAAIESRIAEAVHGIDPLEPVTDQKSLASLRSTSLASPQLTMVLSLSFALVALLLTGAGLAGVMAFSVAQRTQELGIRMALGAQHGTVVLMVLRQAMTLVAVGLVVGVGAAVVVGRGLGGLLFGVRPTDPATFALVLLGVVTVTLAACLLPARRATRINPLRALRTT